MKSSQAVFAKMDKREPKTIREIAFCERESTQSKTLCFAVVFLVFWELFLYLGAPPARPAGARSGPGF